MIRLRIWADLVGLAILAVFCGVGFALFPGIEEITNHWLLYFGIYGVIGARRVLGVERG